MGEYLDDLWNDLEQTWELAMKVNDLQEMIEAIQLKHGWIISRLLISLMLPERSQR